LELSNPGPVVNPATLGWHRIPLALPVWEGPIILRSFRDAGLTPTAGRLTPDNGLNISERARQANTPWPEQPDRGKFGP